MGDERFLAILNEMADMHRRKATDYGSDEDPLANVRAAEEVGVEAWVGAWIRAKDKVRRIDRFCRRGWLKNETVEDSLQDLASYAVIALVLFREAAEKRARAEKGE